MKGPAARILAAAAALPLLAGCASFSADGGMAPVSQRVVADIGVEPRKLVTEQDFTLARDQVAQYLGAPLTADAAVQIAVANNRGLQARYNALGVSEADFVRTSLPANPSIGYSGLSGNGVVKVETHLSIELLGLVTLPLRRELGERQFEAAKYEAAEATLRLGADARRAFYAAAAAQQVALYLEQALRSAESAAELTRRLAETGASTRLDQARAAALYLEVANDLRRARLDAQVSREALTRLLGLWGADIDYRLPPGPPTLPASLAVTENPEAEAVRRRVDLVAMRQDLDGTARALGLTRATRFISVLELTGIWDAERHADETDRMRGFEVAVQIPLFDFGEVAARRTQETYMQAVNRLVERAINVRSEARAAYVTYRTAYDIARAYSEEIVPLRRVIDEEALYRYNGMLIDVFSLLTTARESIATNVATIQAIRDFYIAETDFHAAITGGGAAPAGAGGVRTQAGVTAAPAGH